MAHIPDREFARLWKLKPMAAADCVAVRGDKIILVRRATEPFKGSWVLPGGIMNNDETAEHTALRELKEETGASGKIISLLGAYSGPRRDPRGNTLTVVYIVKITKEGNKHDKEVSDVKFFPFDKLPRDIGFDHRKMVNDAFKLFLTKKKLSQKEKYYKKRTR